MTTIKEQLEQGANEAYYSGQDAVLTDNEFDLLSDNGLDQDTRNFRNKRNHIIPMGSLHKKTNSADLARWWKTNDYSYLVIMPKLDGCSIAQSYRFGALEMSLSRGDGVEGSEITSNIFHTQSNMILQDDHLPKNMEIRSEAIMPKFLESKFKSNLRNVVSGKIMAKDSDPALAYIDTVVFDVFDNEATTQPSWEQKREWLNTIPNSVKFIEYAPTDADSIYDDLANIFADFADYDYAIDGLVVMGLKDPSEPLPEAILMPEHKVAVKFPKDGMEANIGGIQWQLGQYSRLTPVLLLNPSVRIDGTDVGRCSSSNYGLLKAAGLGIGATVSIVKAGDIIPAVKSVIIPSSTGLELPHCPACGHQSELDERGIDAICVNEQCKGKTLVVLQKLIELFDIDYVSDSTIENLYGAGFDTLEKLFTATVKDISGLSGFAQKSAHHIVNSLANVAVSEAQLIKAVGLKGIGVRKATFLLNHYGSLDNLLASVPINGVAGDVEAFGAIHSQLIQDNITKIIAMRDRFNTIGITINSTTPVAKSNIATTEQINICATGKAPMPRSEFDTLVQEHGYSLVGAVTKTTQILVCADPDSNSSKLKKARSLGVEILSYNDFLERMTAPTQSAEATTTHDETLAELNVTGDTESLFSLW